MVKLNRFLPRSTLLGVGKASPYTIAAGVAVAVCQVLNQLLLDSSGLHVWRDVIAVVLTAAGAYGIQPLFGPALVNLLHIPAQVLFFIAAAISGLGGVISVLTMSDVLHAVLAGLLTLIGAVFFGSPIFTPPAPARPATL